MATHAAACRRFCSKSDLARSVSSIFLSLFLRPHPAA
jgi:hypothetical protein